MTINSSWIKINSNSPDSFSSLISCVLFNPLYDWLKSTVFHLYYDKNKFTLRVSFNPQDDIIQIKNRSYINTMWYTITIINTLTLLNSIWFIFLFQIYRNTYYCILYDYDFNHLFMTRKHLLLFPSAIVDYPLCMGLQTSMFYKKH